MYLGVKLRQMYVHAVIKQFTIYVPTFVCTTSAINITIHLTKIMQGNKKHFPLTSHAAEEASFAPEAFLLFLLLLDVS